MNTEEFKDVIEGLISEYCLFLVETSYVEDVGQWCEENGFGVDDPRSPMRLLVSGTEGCKLVIMDDIPDDIVAERIKAMSVRDTLQSAAEDRGAMLDSDKKRLAYLFLSEYASTLPELVGDELLGDNWAFGEMERLGFFRE